MLKPVLFCFVLCLVVVRGFHMAKSRIGSPTSVQMNLIDDAFRFFTNLNKEASAKHILIKGPEASKKLAVLKEELSKASDVSAAFSELAMKVSQCPSASRGGNLGTFKPGMMVREFDKVVFEKSVGEVHGPVETQFGSHLILITRRYDGKKDTEESKSSVRET